MSDIKALVAAEIAQLVDPQVVEMASALAAKYPGARAVLFYGSCLREQQLDGLMLDFYLIVADYDQAYGKSWLARANRMIPPNVFPFTHGNLSSKYAVLSAADFAALNGPAASNVSVWARFSQPTRLVWRADEAAEQAVISAISTAGQTLFHFARPICASTEPLAIWNAGFAETYRAELRAERSGRSGTIVDSDPDRYQRFGAAMPPETDPLSKDQSRRRWRQMQRKGKMLTVVRLAKASFTFAGGIDYLAWKINRHAGTQIEIKPWQRRWPLIAAIGLVPRLLLRGAVR